MDSVVGRETAPLCGYYSIDFSVALFSFLTLKKCHFLAKNSGVARDSFARIICFSFYYQTVSEDFQENIVKKVRKKFWGISVRYRA